MESIENIVILAIETSCDETAAAVVRNGREVLSNVISSQIDLHTLMVVWYQNSLRASILRK